MEARLTFTAGCFVRTDLVGRVRAFLFREGADYTLDENRGWLESEYYLTIRGVEAGNLAHSVRSLIKAYE